MLDINVIYEQDVHKQYECISKIDKLHCANITYDNFFRNYMLKNIPIIIEGISQDWQCTSDWVTWTDNAKIVGKVNFDYLRDSIPKSTVAPIVNCQGQIKFEMEFMKFLEHWQQQCDDTAVVSSTSISKKEKELFYLKDWHLRNIMPEYQFYNVPKYFGSDWLNEYLLQCGADDYRFVYMGINGTW